MISKEERKALTVSDDYIRFRGGRIKVAAVESRAVQFLFHGLRLDILNVLLTQNWKNNVEKSFKTYLTEDEYADEKLKSVLRKDILSAYIQGEISGDEYFLFNLRNKTKEERSQYLSEKRLVGLMSKTGTRKIHNIELNEKCNFYKIAGEYFKRSAVTINGEGDFGRFADLLREQKKLIIKPASVGCGTGIFIKEYISDDDTKTLFDKMMQKGSSYIAEELIVQDPRMAAWNASCINTVRINTFKNKNGVFNHICFMRTGRAGSIVDNGGLGGIFACINTTTGCIDTDGYDEHQHRYACHPDSGLTYKGWEVPGWHEVLALAKHIHATLFEEHAFIGWDFALSDKGWVLIEGNWGSYFAQQICYDKGCKQEVINLLKGTNND